MIETIEQYQKNKRKVMEKYKERLISPLAIANMFDVPIVDIYDIDELDKAQDMKKLDDLLEVCHVEIGTSLSSMWDFGTDKLVFIFYLHNKMNFFFVMDNNQSFRVMYSSFGSSNCSPNLTDNLISIFEKYKIEELKDRESWIPIYSRLEILDL